MNWYKISHPLMQRNRNLQYTDIGHKKDSKAIMFIITKNFKLIEKEIINPDYNDTNDNFNSLKHEKWIENLGISGDNIVATGRYDPESNMASVIYFYSYITQQDYTSAKIAKLLDKRFGNPTIIEF